MDQKQSKRFFFPMIFTIAFAFVVSAFVQPQAFACGGVCGGDGRGEGTETYLMLKSGGSGLGAVVEEPFAGYLDAKEEIEDDLMRGRSEEIFFLDRELGLPGKPDVHGSLTPLDELIYEVYGTTMADLGGADAIQTSPDVRSKGSASPAGRAPAYEAPEGGILGFDAT